MLEQRTESKVRIDGPDLAINQLPPCQSWSVQGSNGSTLDQFCIALFGHPVESGAKAGLDTLRLLRLWPDRGLLLSQSPTIPVAVQTMSDMLTDISHASCTFRLGGKDAYSFLDSYTTADLFDSRIQSAGCVICRCGHYSITAWWDKQDEIQLRVDRSLSQSFLSRLKHLSGHWQPISCVKSGRSERATG